MRAAGVVGEYLERLAAALSTAGTEDAAASAIESVLGGVADDADLGALIEENNTRAHMAGQLFVREIELSGKRIGEAKAAGRDTDRAVALAEPRRATIIDIEFEEAIRHFASRRIMSADEFDALREELRSAAFTVRHMTSDALIESMKRRLETAVAPGGVGLRAFIDEFAARVDDGTANPRAYLENVFRTNTATSYGAGRLTQQTMPEVVAATGYWEYVAVEDSRVRPEHLALNGKQWRINDPEALRVYPPNGYQCFSPDTIVQGNALLGVRTRYSGEMVHLSTKSGRILSVTPNHPLLTTRGFVAACELTDLDDLLCYESGVERDSVVAVHPENPPARIEDVFNALLVRNGSVRARVVARDLHGDADRTDGEIDVVASDRELLDRIKAQASGESTQRVLVSAATGLAPEMGSGGPFTREVALSDSAGRSPSGAALAQDRIAVELHCRPLEQLRIGTASALYAPLRQPPGDDIAADLEFARDLVLGLPGQITTDHIIAIDRRPYAGHVFDLQSANGWIVAGGIVASNCRCVMVTVDREDVNATSLRRRVDATAATQEGFDGPPR